MTIRRVLTILWLVMTSLFLMAFQSEPEAVPTSDTGMWVVWILLGLVAIGLLWLAWSQRHVDAFAFDSHAHDDHHDDDGHDPHAHAHGATTHDAHDVPTVAIVAPAPATPTSAPVVDEPAVSDPDLATDSTLDSSAIYAAPDPALAATPMSDIFADPITPATVAPGVTSPDTAPAAAPPADSALTADTPPPVSDIGMRSDSHVPTEAADAPSFGEMLTPTPTSEVPEETLADFDTAVGEDTPSSTVTIPTTMSDDATEPIPTTRSQAATDADSLYEDDDVETTPRAGLGMRNRPDNSNSDILYSPDPLAAEEHATRDTMEFRIGEDTPGEVVQRPSYGETFTPTPMSNTDIPKESLADFDTDEVDSAAAIAAVNQNESATGTPLPPAITDDATEPIGDSPTERSKPSYGLGMRDRPRDIEFKKVEIPDVLPSARGATRDTMEFRVGEDNPGEVVQRPSYGETFTPTPMSNTDVPEETLADFDTDEVDSAAAIAAVNQNESATGTPLPPSIADDATEPIGKTEDSPTERSKPTYGLGMRDRPRDIDFKKVEIPDVLPSARGATRDTMEFRVGEDTEGVMIQRPHDGETTMPTPMSNTTEETSATEGDTGEGNDEGITKIFATDQIREEDADHELSDPLYGLGLPDQSRDLEVPPLEIPDIPELSQGTADSESAPTPSYGETFTPTPNTSSDAPDETLADFDTDEVDSRASATQSQASRNSAPSWLIGEVSTTSTPAAPPRPNTVEREWDSATLEPPNSASAAGSTLPDITLPKPTTPAADAPHWLVVPSSDDEDDRDDDLQIIEGIGPKIAEILKGSGLRSFRRLAKTNIERLREVLDNAGISHIADPATWAEQAQHAADGAMDKLQELQARLKGGRKDEESQS
jgi:predicted flap endonuclease-1-like 5' DNA nuclease